MLRLHRFVPNPELRVRRTYLLVMVMVAGMVAMPSRVAGAEPARKVAIIVGPVGAELTPVYIDIAEAAARRAEASGAAVARVYSPNATPRAVLSAVEGANIVVYLGHGVGVPNPYSEHPNPQTVNGWALQGPHARGDHSDSWRDGTLKYYGEAWIAAHAHPAPGWVMIYSNACYAAGAGEPSQAPATRKQATSRVASYARAPLEEMGASAVFATDFFESAAQLVGAILSHPEKNYGEIYASETRFRPGAVTRLPYPGTDGRQMWLQRSAYFDGKVDFWYSFAGDPGARPAAGSAERRVDPPVTSPEPAPVVAFGSAIPPSGIVTGNASSYAGQAGWNGAPTVALPVGYGGRITDGEPQWIKVCADHCVLLPVVDSCPCYAGTSDARVANLSLSAWRLVSDAPIEEGLIPVTVYLTGQPSPAQLLRSRPPAPY
jgi:hypothetical protein